MLKSEKDGKVVFFVPAAHHINPTTTKQFVNLAVSMSQPTEQL
jgi:hypothetical protein